MSAEEGASPNEEMLRTETTETPAVTFEFCGEVFTAADAIPFGAIVVVGMNADSEVQRLREVMAALEKWTIPADRPRLRMAAMSIVDASDVSNALAEALDELCRAVMGRPT